MRTGYVLAWVAMASSALLAQQSGADINKNAKDMAGRLEQARQNSQVEAARSAAEKTNDTGALDSAAARARALDSQPQPYAEKVMAQAADARLDQALKNVSPDGQKILAQNTPAPALRAPEPERIAGGKPAAAPASAPAATAGKGKPKAEGGAKDAPAKDTKIVITAQGAAYFDSKESMAVFTDDVVVVHPQFTMNCDELEVYMKKEKAPEKKAEGDAAASPDKAAPAASTDPTDTGGIDKAIGKGRKVVIQKADENGEPQIGICRHCTYDGPTGDVTLRDYPQVQRGKNVIIATSPTTYMILKASGELKTFGPNKVDIIQEAKKAPAPQGAAAPQNPNGPTPPASPAKPAAGTAKPKGGQP